MPTIAARFPGRILLPPLKRVRSELYRWSHDTALFRDQTHSFVRLAVYNPPEWALFTDLHPVRAALCNIVAAVASQMTHAECESIAEDLLRRAKLKLEEESYQPFNA